jgi:hypothetical protein
MIITTHFIYSRIIFITLYLYFNCMNLISSPFWLFLVLYRFIKFNKCFWHSKSRFPNIKIFDLLIYKFLNFKYCIFNIFTYSFKSRVVYQFTTFHFFTKIWPFHGKALIMLTLTVSLTAAFRNKWIGFGASFLDTNHVCLLRVYTIRDLHIYYIS